MPSSIELTPQMMREIIMDHYSHPSHKMKPEDVSSYQNTHSASVNCIDDIDVYIKLDGNTVVDACWDGVACAISTASSDILCDLLIGKSKEEADYVIAQYENMIYERDYDGSVLDEALAFMNTHNQPARIHCATIGWDAALDILHPERKEEE